AIPADAEFVVHLGDIKTGSTPCDEAVYKKVFGMLRQSKAPVFIIPGDNEWNDCTDPDQAWRLWERYFMRFDRRWQHALPVIRQWEHEENFSFVTGGVLFVGLNIVGGRVHDAAEWKRRHAADLDWVRRNLRRFGAEVNSLVILGHARPVQNHSDFFDPFTQDALKFQKPILYIHGDGHLWIYDRPFAARNILRVQVDQGGIAPPLKVTVTGDKTTPFQFDRRNGQPAK
ncbi:MAG: metallophosphoesterase, partial [Planctomycetaceae bacterium]|nr:metallophosphoesterase [Planctomycetaceae bacterium]